MPNSYGFPYAHLCIWTCVEACIYVCRYAWTMLLLYNCISTTVQVCVGVHALSVLLQEQSISKKKWDEDIHLQLIHFWTWTGRPVAWRLQFSIRKGNIKCTGAVRGVCTRVWLINRHLSTRNVTSRAAPPAVGRANICFRCSAWKIHVLSGPVTGSMAQFQSDTHAGRRRSHTQNTTRCLFSSTADRHRKQFCHETFSLKEFLFF